MAGEYARKGVGEVAPPSVIPPRNTTQNRSTIIRFDGRWCKEVTPEGLYFRQGRVDERSEIYPVLMKPTRNPTPLWVVLSLIPRTFSLHLAIVLPGAAVSFVLRLYALWAKIQSKKNGL